MHARALFLVVLLLAHPLAVLALWHPLPESSKGAPLYSLVLPPYEPTRPVDFQASAPLDLYVSPNGQDTNPGTQALPFRTPTGARDHIRSLASLPVGGVTVHVAQGLYPPLQLAQVDSGQAAAPIAYVGEPAGAALVSAGVNVPSSLWTQISMPSTQLLVYKADLTKLNITDFGRMLTGGLGDCQHDKLELFYRDEPMVLSRYPNIFPNGTWAYIGVTGAPSETSVEMKVVGDRPSRWMHEENPWLHGYFAWDWWDVYAPLLGVKITGSSATLATNVSLQTEKSGRFYAVNMLSELDALGEYYVTGQGLLYFIPPEQAHPDASAVVSVAEHALEANAISFVSFQGLSFAHARQEGATLQSVRNVNISACNFSLNGGRGVDLSGEQSSIRGSEVAQVGCTALSVSGGDVATLAPANLVVDGNNIHHYGRWKRTYQPGVLWRGVNITVSNNYIGFAPHNGILGGGNEGGGNFATFEYNTIDSVCLDTADAGAFYTCGQDGEGWISRGNVVRHNTFKHIRNVQGGSHGGLAVNAIYLDDQTSGYDIYNNTFEDCVCGIMVGGGRDNHAHDNYLQQCDLAIHIDNRGMNWQNSSARFPTGELWVGVGNIHPFQDPWASAFPKLWNLSYCGVPVFNDVHDNTFCKNTKDIDFLENIQHWLLSYYGNGEKCV